jgi:nucleoid-associated protein YgaU
MKKNTVTLAVSALFVLVSCAGAPKPPALPPPLPAASAKTESAAEIPQQQPEIPRQQQQPERVSVAPASPQQQAALRQQPPSPQPQLAQAGGIILEGAYTHTVRDGDTLAHIAERFYGRGNGYYYGLIMLASRLTNPNLIVPGATLTVPVLQRNLDDPGARSRLKAYSLEIAGILARRGYSRDSRNMRTLAASL